MEMPRVSFLVMLGEYGVDMFNDTDAETLQRDAENA